MSAAPASGRDVSPRSVVALVECPDYDGGRVQAALRRGVDLLGGIDRFVAPAETILLKPNMLSGAARRSTSPPIPRC